MTLRTRTLAAKKERQSQGAGQTLFGKGGLGYIARRGIDLGSSIAVRSLEGVARLAATQPLELLSLLPDLVPEIGLALWNSTNLGCGPDRFRIKAVTRKADGSSEEAPEGTAAIASLWENNPDEAGDLVDCAGQMFQMLQFAGMNACEAVPGGRNKGIAAVYPINSLTLRFRRDDAGVLVLDQRQLGVNNGLGFTQAGLSGLFVPMPMERVFWTRLPGLPDEPYGRAPFGAALTVVLECLAFWRDVMLSFHRIGTPKLDVSFDFEMWYRIAKEVVGYTTQEEIDRYVDQKYAEAVEMFEKLEADDTFFHGQNDKVNSVGSGDSWPDLSAIWSMLRLRLIQSLKMLPTLLGVVEGDTETWSRVQWDIFTTGLLLIVNKALKPLVKASNLHLQLLGMPFTAVAEIEPIRSIARLTDAQAVAQEILNEEAKVQNNWQTNITASTVITGSAPPDEASRKADVPTKGQEAALTAPVGNMKGGLNNPGEQNA